MAWVASVMGRAVVARHWETCWPSSMTLEGRLSHVATSQLPFPLLAGAFLIVLIVVVALIVTRVFGKSARQATVVPRSYEKRTSSVSTTVAPSVSDTVDPALRRTPKHLKGSPDRQASIRTRSSKRRLYVASFSDKGGRDVNEDSVGKRMLETTGDQGLCVVVADGLGGHGGGERASEVAVRSVLDAWRDTFDEQDLKMAFEGAHAAVQAIQTPTSDMRTTAVALLIASGRACWANAGDSRLYHFRDGQLVFQTIDHSVSQMSVMLGQITSDQIRGHADRARLTKALGQEGTLSPDAGTIEIADGDEHAFLLCSDGFWEYVEEAEMVQALGKATSPADWLSRMRALHELRAPKDCDNNSAVAVWQTARYVEEA